MFKYRLSALARLLVYHALAMVFLQGLLSAQVTLPPIIGDSMWTKSWASEDRSPDASEFGANASNALAEGVGRVFRATRAGFMVLDASNGSIIENVPMSTIVKNHLQSRRIYCDYSGSKLLIFYRGTDSLRMLLISYPDKKILKQFTFDNYDEFSWNVYHGAVSPDGRWIVVPHRWYQDVPYLLYDTQRDTTLSLLLWGSSSWSFTKDSKTLAYAQYTGDENGKLTLVDLSGPGITLRHFPNTSLFRDPKISADGQYVIAISTKWSSSEYFSWPQLSVIECATGKVVWQISGSMEYWTARSKDIRFDLNNYAISRDGRYVYAYRKDTIDRLGTVIDEGFFYRIPDPVPIARTIPGTVASNAPDRIHYNVPCGFTSFSSDLRRAFVEANQLIKAYKTHMVAMQFDDLITGIFGNASATGSSHIIYPNPTTGSLTLNWTNSHETVYWQLLDTSGSILFYASSPVMNGKVQIEIPQSLAIGRYSLLVRDATARTVEHHVVIKN
jgi:hypothetical protein